MTGGHEEKCICPRTACARHGKCCECIKHHRDKGDKVYCMRDRKNKSKSKGLPKIRQA